MIRENTKVISIGGCEIGGKNQLPSSLCVIQKPKMSKAL